MEIDRDKLARLDRLRSGRFRSLPSALARALRARPRVAARRRPDELDGALGGRPPGLPCEAEGARVTDVDGNEYVDLCLGDTGAMAGHAPAATVRAVAERMAAGATAMLPTEDSVGAAEELARRFGLPHWQLTLSATDANRFAIRLARQITGRPKILVFNYCYHGTVDETLHHAAR